jgi:hypothetical protein
MYLTQRNKQTHVIIIVIYDGMEKWTRRYNYCCTGDWTSLKLWPSFLLIHFILFLGVTQQHSRQLWLYVVEQPMKDELVATWKQLFVAYFNVLPRHSPEVTEWSNVNIWIFGVKTDTRPELLMTSDHTAVRRLHPSVHKCAGHIACTQQLIFGKVLVVRSVPRLTYSSPCTQKPATGPYSDPVKSSPYFHTVFLSGLF